MRIPSAIVNFGSAMKQRVTGFGGAVVDTYCRFRFDMDAAELEKLPESEQRELIIAMSNPEDPRDTFRIC